MDFGLSPANTPDKLNSVIVPTTRVIGLTNGSDWIWPRHDIEEVTAERVSKKSVQRLYLKNEFETMKEVQNFEWENISMTRPTLDNISPSQNGKEHFTISPSQNGKEHFTISPSQNGKKHFTISPSN